jgi:hypothetical protein
MVKTSGAKEKAQTHFEQVPLDVVKKVLGGDAVLTNGGTKRLRDPANTPKPHNPAGSVAKAAIKSKASGRPR